MSNPLVLLHPLGVDHRFWTPVLAELGGRFPARAPDLLGHGAAPLPPPGASVADYARAVEQLLHDERAVTLVGVSLGGLVAQELAVRRPDLVDRLVLADTVAVYPEQMRTMWLDRAATVRSRGTDAVVEPTVSLWFTAEVSRAGGDAVEALRTQLRGCDPEGYARTCEALAAADTSAGVGSIEVPTAVLCGEADAPPFRAAAEWFVDTLPDASLTWLPGAHGTAFEHPQAFAEALVAAV